DKLDVVVDQAEYVTPCLSGEGVIPPRELVVPQVDHAMARDAVEVQHLGIGGPGIPDEDLERNAALPLDRRHAATEERGPILVEDGEADLRRGRGAGGERGAKRRPLCPLREGER